MFSTNQNVETSLGKGTVQAPRFTVKDGAGADITTGVLVRLPLTDEVRKHLRKSFCVTPNASSVSALFVFQESELK
jgi:hypothetical protein